VLLEILKKLLHLKWDKYIFWRWRERKQRCKQYANRESEKTLILFTVEFEQIQLSLFEWYIKIKEIYQKTDTMSTVSAWYSWCEEKESHKNLFNDKDIFF